MPKQPGDALTEIIGELAERTSKYAEVWQKAAARNAANDYDAVAATADLQKTFTFAVRDMAEIGAAWIEALAGFVTAPPAPAKQTPAAKKAAAKRAPAKKAPK